MVNIHVWDLSNTELKGLELVSLEERFKSLPITKVLEILFEEAIEKIESDWNMDREDLGSLSESRFSFDAFVSLKERLYSAFKKHNDDLEKNYYNFDELPF